MRSPAWRRGLKALVSLQLQHRSQLRLGLSPWPRNYRVLRVGP